VSGLVFDFSCVIEKYESGAAEDICEEDMEMLYLCGPQSKWGEPLKEKPVEKPRNQKMTKTTSSCEK
jgi:hypothetical protein